MDASDVKSCLVDSLEGTADWRDRKAKEYPDDARNKEVSDALYRSAEQIKVLEVSNPQIQRYAQLWEIAGDNHTHRFVEIESNIFGSIYYSHEEATSLLTSLISEFEEVLEPAT